MLGLIEQVLQAQGSEIEEVAGVDLRVLKRTQAPWGMTALFGGEPRNSLVR